MHVIVADHVMAQLSVVVAPTPARGDARVGYLRYFVMFNDRSRSVCCHNSDSAFVLLPNLGYVIIPNLVAERYDAWIGGIGGHGRVDGDSIAGYVSENVSYK